MKQFITSIIGDDYKNWNPKDCVLITSSTGSGKSTFVLQTLLPYAVAANKHIVYICNRRILKEQFSELSKQQLKALFETADHVPDEQLSYIHVTTYQHCEQSKQFPDFRIKPDMSGLSRIEKEKRRMQGKFPPDITLNSKDVLYYIFDEAHYFVADAVFNADTNYWYNKGSAYSIEDFSHSVYIFLTATPEPLMCFLGCRNNRNWFSHSKVVNNLLDRNNLRKQLSEQKEIRVKLKDRGKPDHELHMNSERYINERCREIRPYETPISTLKGFIEQGNKNGPGYHVYDLPMDYSYVTPVYFSQYTQLVNLILQSQEKWLVFVDHEPDGIDLVGRLQQEGVNAAYLSAKTCNQKNSTGRIEFINISRSQKFDCKVLVATSVLDCGVNIVDTDVKNVVIGHSDKTTFLQMLGRKRVSVKTVSGLK